MARNLDTLDAESAFRELIGSADDRAFIDVRAESEFRQGHLPGFVSAPLLQDAERHFVGIRYKEKGQASAIELGHQLVDPHRPTRVFRWAEIARSKTSTPFVCCWRGGLRSEISVRWMRESGVEAARVLGGYKALRNLCLEQLRRAPELLVLSGPTGSGKTQLLREVAAPKLDLEDIARHRGSAFGSWATNPQPGQATFENALAIELARLPARECLVEDESSTIGAVRLPTALFDKISRAPVLRIESSLEDRAQRVFEEYVTAPLAGGQTPAALETRLQSSLKRIARRLGGAAYAEISRDLKNAFETPNAEAHKLWVTKLLRLYYDPLYDYSFARFERPVLYRGSTEECRAWIHDRYASPKR